MVCPSSNEANKSADKDSVKKSESPKSPKDTASVASKFSSDKKSIKDGSKEAEPKRIKLLNTQMNENIIKCIEEECKGIKENEDASKIAEKLYKMLEKKFPKGWCVFAGSHFYGLCVHEENHCLEFEIDDCRVGVFKTYLPIDKK